MAIATMDYIDVDDNGVARIVGSRMKVIHLVMERQANGWTVEEVHAGHPNLTLAQVYGVFAFYHDHKDELDAQIQRSVEFAEQMRRQAGESPVAKRLREQGLLP